MPKLEKKILSLLLCHLSTFLKNVMYVYVYKEPQNKHVFFSSLERPVNQCGNNPHVRKICKLSLIYEGGLALQYFNYSN